MWFGSREVAAGLEMRHFTGIIRRIGPEYPAQIGTETDGDPKTEDCDDHTRRIVCDEELPHPEKEEERDCERDENFVGRYQLHDVVWSPVRKAIN